jgi:cytochrome c oxidase subunit 1
LFLNASFLVGAAPNAGWFAYANLTNIQYSPGLNVDFWVLGLQILGVASIAAGVNFIVTIVNMRAPGMRIMRMPVFTWMTLVTQFIVVTAFPVITVALVFLMFDRTFGTTFYSVAAGGDVLLWQHLFWLFGHPEVYILILPAMGIISEVIPTFSRKPLFGYAIVVYSGLPIGILGMALLGVPFVVGSTRSMSTGSRISIGVVIGILFYLGERTLGQLALLYDLPPVPLAVGPDLVILALAIYALSRAR